MKWGIGGGVRRKDYWYTRACIVVRLLLRRRLEAIDTTLVVQLQRQSQLSRGACWPKTLSLFHGRDLKPRSHHKESAISRREHPARPRTSLKFGELAFSVAGPAAWNSHPADIRTTSSTTAFKKRLNNFSILWVLWRYRLLRICHFCTLFYCIFVMELASCCCKKLYCQILFLLLLSELNGKIIHSRRTIEVCQLQCKQSHWI